MKRDPSFLEKLAEDLVEGTINRALKAKLQPVQIAKALARAMEGSQIVGTNGPLAANQYHVYLHPKDFATFAAFQTSLERDLSLYLQDCAARRGLRTLTSPSVKLLPAEAPSVPGHVHVEATLVDPEPAPPAQEAPPVWEGTVAMPMAQPVAATASEPPSEDAAASSTEPPVARLEDESGHFFDLGKGGTRLGRAIDNDIVVEESGVSRHHARIVWEDGGYILLDLQSTNGSFAAGVKVARHLLSDGDQLSFGGARFVFRLITP